MLFVFLEEVRFLNDEADDTEQEQRIVVLAEDSGRERKRKKSGSGKLPMGLFMLERKLHRFQMRSQRFQFNVHI